MEGLKYLWRLRKLQRARARDDRHYDMQIAKATSPDEAENLEREAWHVDQDHQHMIGKEQTRRLFVMAERLMVPLPDMNDPKTWNDDRRWGDLSRTAMADLRSRIRRERTEASQFAMGWLSALTGLGGVLVAIIALLAGG